jgi:hypothetical protein
MSTHSPGQDRQNNDILLILARQRPTTFVRFRSITFEFGANPVLDDRTAYHLFGMQLKRILLRLRSAVGLPPDCCLDNLYQDCFYLLISKAL